MIRIVVPLPDQWQYWLTLPAVELIGCYNARDQSFACRKIKCVGHFAIHTQYGPVILPHHRHQVRYAADRTKITEQVCKPRSFWCADQTTLGNTFVLQCNTSFIRAGNLIGTMDNDCAHTAFRPDN